MDIVRDLIYTINAGLISLEQTNKITQVIVFTKEDLYELKTILQEYERLKNPKTGKEEILEYFKDINFVYNDCTRFDTLKRMLSEL